MQRRKIADGSGPKTLVCTGCSQRRDRKKDFYATPDGKVRGRKCIKCVRRDRMAYHEERKSDPEYVAKMRAASLGYWFANHEENLKAQRERDKKRRRNA